MKHSSVFSILKPLYYFGKWTGFIQFSIVGQPRHRVLKINLLDRILFLCQIMLCCYCFRAYVRNVSKLTNYENIVVLTYNFTELPHILMLTAPIICGLMNKKTIFEIIKEIDEVYLELNIDIDKSIFLLFIFEFTAYAVYIYVIKTLSFVCLVEIIIFITSCSMELFCITIIWILQNLLRKIGKLNDKTVLNKIFNFDNLLDIANNLDHLLNYVLFKIMYSVAVIVSTSWYITISHQRSPINYLSMIILWNFTNLFNVFLFAWFCNNMKNQVSILIIFLNFINFII